MSAASFPDRKCEGKCYLPPTV